MCTDHDALTAAAWCSNELRSDWEVCEKVGTYLPMDGGFLRAHRFPRPLKLSPRYIALAAESGVKRQSKPNQSRNCWANFNQTFVSVSHPIWPPLLIKVLKSTNVIVIESRKLQKWLKLSKGRLLQISGPKQKDAFMSQEHCNNKVSLTSIH